MQSIGLYVADGRVGVEEEVGALESKVLKSLPPMSRMPQANSPQPPDCDSSSYRSAGASKLHFWEIGHHHMGYNFKAALKHSSKQAPPKYSVATVLHLPFRRITFIS